MAQRNSQPNAIFAHRRRRRWLLLVLAIIFVYILVPQLGNFKTSLHMLAHARAGGIGWGLAALAASYLLASLTYCLLAKRRLHYPRTLLIEIASMFTNRLLPAGIGAMGINYAYLRRQGHQRSEATSVVAMNNLLGICGHLLLLAIALVLGVNHPQFKAPSSGQLAVLAGSAMIILLVIWLVLRWKRQMIRRFWRQTLREILAYRKRPLRLGLALLSSLLLSSCYATMLYAASRAVGMALPAADIFIVLSLGVAGATVVPTPGGLGGAEASLAGGFVLLGASDAQALAAALLYRLLTYWLAMLLGLVSFLWAQRLRYI